MTNINRMAELAEKFNLSAFAQTQIPAYFKQLHTEAQAELLDMPSDGLTPEEFKFEFSLLQAKIHFLRDIHEVLQAQPTNQTEKE